MKNLRNMRVFYIQGNRVYNNIRSINLVNNSITVEDENGVLLEIPSCNVILMRSTGIKDSSDNIIKEGDIIEISSPIGTEKAWITYSNKYGQFVTKSSNLIFEAEPLGDIISIYDVKILGNIYEDFDIIKEDIEKCKDPLNQEKS